MDQLLRYIAKDVVEKHNKEYFSTQIDIKVAEYCCYRAMEVLCRKLNIDDNNLNKEQNNDN